MFKIILYGAGKYADATFAFFKANNMENMIEAFCDKNAKNIKTKNKLPVIDYETAKRLNIPFLIAVLPGSRAYDEIKSSLTHDNLRYYKDVREVFISLLGRAETEFERAFVVFWHKYNMDGYYERCELPQNAGIFWDETGMFYNMFKKLNLENVIELACGKGRHLPHYIANAGNVTLVDVLESNINDCKKRFSAHKNVSYYKNNGKDLNELADESYTALFSYDAMVHFEMLDVAKYLAETYRVLKNGGLGLFHHSNNHDNYKLAFRNAKGGRSYMSDELFAYLANRAGLEVVKQQIITWSSTPNLDCITLVRKNTEQNPIMLW